MALGGVLQFLALPFADLVLISTNSIAAIIFNTFLSIQYLGEKFIWKYDVPAFSFMGLGGVIIVMMAKTDDRKYTPEQIKELLTQSGSVTCTIVGLLSLIFTLIYLKVFLAQIGKFQEDIDKWVSVQLNTVSDSQVNRSPEQSSFRRSNSDQSIDSTIPLD